MSTTSHLDPPTSGTGGLMAGHAAGVPFVAMPPANGPRPSAPVVVAWHFMDPPRTEAAFAAAVPLSGLDAWRIYLGLPLSGSRLPGDGFDEIVRRGFQDAVLQLHRPVAVGAAEEFPAAFGELRQRLGIGSGPIGLMGGSIGAAVAQLVLAEGELDVSAAVLISPMVQLRRAADAMAQSFGTSYLWSQESSAVAGRLDFVARAGEMARRGRPALLLIVGEHDDEGFLEPAAELQAALARAYGSDERSRLVTVAAMAHAIADEPGLEPAPQTPHARGVELLGLDWFERHLIEGHDR